MTSEFLLGALMLALVLAAIPVGIALALVAALKGDSHDQ